MYRIVFTYLHILLFSTIAFSQESVTLDKAISYAMEHSPVLNVNKMKLAEASIQLEESRLQYIPDIYLSGDVRRNLIISATPVPANVFDSSAEEGETMYLKFNTKWNSSGGLNLTYDLFNPEKINSLAQQQHKLRIQEYDTEISESELKDQVSLAYAACVISDEQKRLLKVDTAYYKELLNNADQLFRKERISKSERNDAHKAYNESIATYLEAEKIVNDRKTELIYLIGMDVTEENIKSLTLQEDIPSLLEKFEQKTITTIPSNSLEILRQQEVSDLATLKMKSAQWKYAPTLSLKGYYGTNYYNNELSLFNNKFWRGNSYIGLSLTVPVTRSLTTSKEVSRLRLQKNMESEILRDIHNKREQERLNELSLFQVSKENYRLSIENWELSRQNSDAVQMQFDKGHIQQADLLNEQLKIMQSRHSFLQAAYDLFKCLISMN